MPPYSLTIDKYTVDYLSNDNVEIILESAGTSFAALNFKPNGAILPPNSCTTAPQQYYNLYYHLDDFKNIIDILRNETPLFLYCISAMNPGTPPTQTHIPVGISTRMHQSISGQRQQSSITVCLTKVWYSWIPVFSSHKYFAKRRSSFTNQIEIILAS